MSDDLSLSNSLADLAARIRAEHEAATLAIKRGLAHSIAAGKLLNEAKALLKHGQWLPWLRDHCVVPLRTAQRYMVLAGHAAEAKYDKLSYLPDADVPKLDGPFSSFDVDDFAFTQKKLLHHAKVPAFAAYCFDVMEEDLPTLRLCPWDDLCDAAKGLAAVLDDRNPARFDPDSFASIRDMQRAINDVEIHAMWFLGRVLSEIEYRETVREDDYEAEWQDIHQQLMARLEAQLQEARAGALH
jgi:hypothetical protein